MHACSVMTDSCDFKNCGLAGSFVHIIFQAKILGELPFPTPGYLPNWGIKPPSPTLAGGFFTTENKLGSPYAYVYTLSRSHVFFIHSFIIEHFRCFLTLAIVNNAAISTGMHLSSYISVSVSQINTEKQNFWVIWQFYLIFANTCYLLYNNILTGIR